MIDAREVERVFLDCLLTEGEIAEDGSPLIELIKVEGIVHNFGFNPIRVKKHKETIVGFLEELPPEFRKSVGGGWSFLNACNDKRGNQWGGHRNMEQLFVLGIAIGKAKYLMPRKMWTALPGSMPYIMYIDE